MIMWWKPLPTFCFEDPIGSFSQRPIDSTYGISLYCEVSWPAAKPYLRREKRVYHYEVYNPTPAP